MKVIHVITDLDDGGAEGVLARLCTHTPEIEHIVVSLSNMGKYGAILEAANIPVYCLNMRRSIVSLAKVFILSRLILREKPDVVQTWMYHADLFGGIAARIVGSKNIFWGIRRSTMKKGEISALTKLIAWLCARLSYWLPKRIVCCAVEAKNAHANLGYDKTKMIVIQNGYDVSRFRPNLNRRRIVRKELGISNDDFLIGMVARSHPVKDHATLLNAFALACQHSSDLFCALIGRGMTTENGEISELIRKLEVEDRVFLLGQREDIPAAMNALDLHVLSSLSEGFPNVLAEAMSCGVPCVSTNVGDAKMILLDENDLCPIQDPIALAQLILAMEDECRSMPDDWQVRKQRNTLKIAGNYTIEGMTEAFKSCWSS